MGRHTVNLVRPGQLDPHVVRALEKRLDPLSGKLFLPVRRRYKVDDASEFIIRQLGKTAGPLPKRRRSGRLGSLARAWLTAEQIDLMVVGSAELLTARVVQSLVDHADAIGADIWFVHGDDILPAADRKAFEAVSAHPRTVTELFTVLDSLGRATSSSPPRAARRLAAVPDEEWPTFAAECERQLPPADVRSALAAYRCGADAILCALAERPGDAVCATRAVKDLITARTTRAALVARLRGAQAAGAFNDVFISVNLTQFYAGPATALDEVTIETARALRTSTSFKGPAAYVAVHVSGAPLDLIVSLKMEDVSPTGSELSINETVYAVPELLRPSLLALVQLRKSEGASPRSPLFAKDKDRAASIAPRTLQRELAKLAEHTGVQALIEQNIDAASDDEAWLRRRGVRVRILWPRSAGRGIPPSVSPQAGAGT